jgi:NADPH:quinone reductase-like Zn-dependent oxidoreductase
MIESVAIKADVYNEYGPPEFLKLREVDKPVAQDDEVLVRVHAASVNQWDWDFVRGKPALRSLAGV